ncbi:MAG: response regulator, partial [Gammaproteobacteria bacterium]|nr:response regulator [Gammaproteobacteria bacterium]
RLGLIALSIHIFLAPLLIWGLTSIITLGYQSQFVNQARSNAYLLKSLVTSAMNSSGATSLVTLLDETLESGDLLYVEFRPISGMPIQPDLNAAIAPELVVEDFDFGQHDDAIYFVSAPVLDVKGEIAGELWLGFDEVPTAQEIAVTYQRALLLGALYVTLNVLLAVFLGVQLTAPLRAIRQAARRITSGSDVEQLKVQSTIEEFTDLSHDLDLMHQTLIAQRQEMSQTRDAALNASRSKSEFLARMSHEIRTPMNGVLGMTELLLSSTKLDERQRRYADTIRQSANALLTLINDILDFSKIEAGKLNLEVAPFCLRQIVEDAADILAERAHVKGLELLCDVPPDITTAVAGDGTRVRQILINLIGNAVKFTERGEITTSVRLLESDGEGLLFRFEVRDTGIGVRPENVHEIFESFAQEDGSTTRRYGGSGLGLAICKQLVGLMGGEIGVESVPGTGSTFWFTLRLAADPGAIAGLPRGSLAGSHVLAVDDNATNLEILSQQLHSWGITVVTASSGSQALAILSGPQQTNFDLAILDLHMPEMDGLTLAQEIRRRPELDPLPLVMLSSVSSSIAADDWQKSGLAAWLSKPVRQAQLHTCLESVMRSGSVALAAELGTVRTDIASLRPDHGDTMAGRRVLLVEDNAVNQEVAVAMLRDFGTEVTRAWNGREALELLAAERFDIVLMDCQMPELDGYGATRSFRDWEQRHERPRTPVIALTANAMEGDEQKCLKAGMDGYLSKPFTMVQLRGALEQWGKGADAAAVRSPDPSPPALDERVLDAIRTLETPGSPGLLDRIIGLYAESSRRLTDDLFQAIANGDFEAAGGSAHALKSSSANVGASALAELCTSLEAAARAGRTDQLQQLAAAIDRAHAQTMAALLERRTKAA